MTAAAPMPDHHNLPPDMDRLRWQCRRGMLELDVILSRYLEGRFVTASAEQQMQFRALLSVEDPILNQWLVLGEIPEQEPLATIARRVRGMDRVA